MIFEACWELDELEILVPEMLLFETPVFCEDDVDVLITDPDEVEVPPEEVWDDNPDPWELNKL